MTDGAQCARDKSAIRSTVLTARRVRRAGPAGVEETVIAVMGALAEADRRRDATLLALPELANARTVGAYAALADEPPTAALLAAWVRQGVRVLLPEVQADAGLRWRAVDGTPGALADVDVLVVPAVAVDLRGMRLGRGGGSYDRALAALAALAKPAPVVALVHDEEIVETVPSEAHDRGVDVVVSEKRVLRFS